MGTYIEAGKAGDLEDGAMKEVEVQGRQLLLAMVGGKYYAVDGRCPHMGGRLARGKLEGKVVTCPLHGSQFDLADGRVIRWLKGSGMLSALGKALKGPRPITTYKVKVEVDNILVEL